MHLQVAGGKVLSMVVAYASNCSMDYSAFLGSQSGVVEGLPSRDPTHWEIPTHMWATMEKLEGVWLGRTAYLTGNWVVFCYWTSVLVMVLAISNTMFDIRWLIGVYGTRPAYVKGQWLTSLLCNLICNREETCRAVNWSPPYGEFYQVAGEDAGQTWKTQTSSVG